MPTIYQARCDSCSYASDVFPAEYGAVFLDQPPPSASNTVVAGAVLHDSVATRFAEEEDRRFVVLAHPIEGYILSETGYTWARLAWVGRYVRIRRVVCASCGAFFQMRRLTCPPGLGCQFGCVTGLIGGIAVGVWKRSFWLGFGTAYGLVLGCHLVAATAGWFYTRQRFHCRALEIDGPHCCPQCGSRKYVGIETRRTLPCPKCCEVAMRVRMVGMS